MNTISQLPLIHKSSIFLEKSDKLLRIFEDLHNYIYANEGMSTQQVFEEILKVLLLKIYDEKENKNLFQLSPQEYDTINNGGQSLDFNKRLKELTKNALSYFNDVFDSNEKLKLKINTLAYIVFKLQNINLSESSKDVKGLAFQKFLYSSQRSDRGQFFTPEQIVQLCVEIIQPQKNEKILDPACGSAGFLSQAMMYVFKNSLNKSSEKEKKEYVSKNIFGIEINPMAAKMAKLRMILDGDGYSNITVTNTLQEWDKINLEINKSSNNNNRTYENYFDVILTNPPFGTQGRVSDKSILRQFSLGYKWTESNSKHYKTNILLVGQVPDILFIERCLEFLKPGGRLAIVLPNGDLENISLKYIRQFILDKAEIFSVIKLPDITFIPFGTGVKASLLFLKKKSKQLENNNYIFFGRVNKIGYLGNKNGTTQYKRDNNGKKLLDSNGNYLIDEDFTSLINKYNSYVKNKKHNDDDNSFMIKADALKSRLDVDFYMPSYSKLDEYLLSNNAKKLGDIITIEKKKSPKLKNKETIVNYIELSDINAEYCEIVNYNQLPVYELPSRAAFELNEEDLITAVAGNAIGTKKHVSAIVTKEFEGSICTNGLRVLKIKNDLLSSYYLLYFFTTDFFLQQVYRYRTGAAIPAISDDDLLNILVYFPERKLHDEIVEKVKESVSLRKKSKEAIKNIRLE